MDLRFHIKNFGCRLNQHEGDAMYARLVDAGFIPSPMTEADLVIVNGCVVTGRAEQKVRQFIHKVKRENPGAKLLVTGCTAEAISRGLVGKIDGAEIVERQRMNDIAGLLTISQSHQDVLDFPRFNVKNIPRARAWLKIQDGCQRACSYCIVRIIRGKPRSRRVPDIIDCVNRIVEAGFNEIVLTGTDLGSWEGNNGKMRLPELLRKILDETDVSLIRLSSIEPPGVTEELIDVISSDDRIAPHLHIPLQSGSVDVLSAMNRPTYDPFDVLRRVDKLRAARDSLCVGADIIVGFPSEGDDDFEMTADLLRSGMISYAHLFKFSPRPGTEAAKLKPLPSKTVKARLKVLKSIDDENRSAFAKRFCGKTLRMVVEKCSGGKVLGHTENYLYAVCDGTAERRTIVKIAVQKAEGMKVFGKVEWER